MIIRFIKDSDDLRGLPHRKKKKIKKGSELKVTRELGQKYIDKGVAVPGKYEPVKPIKSIKEAKKEEEK